MKKIVGLTIAILLLASLFAISTWTFFVDTEAATSQLVAGTLDLKTNDTDGVSQTLLASSLKPGDTVGPTTIQLKNSGTVSGSTLNLTFSYIESDGSPNAINMSTDDTAATMEVTAVSYGGSSLLGSVNDNNGNGYTDMYDLKNASLSGLSGIAAAATKDFQIAVQLRSAINVDFKADGIILTMTFTLNQ